MAHPSPWPNKGDKKHTLLSALLNGVRVDPFIALMEMNVSVVQARMAELRKMGWPIRTIRLPHPKLAGETVVAYFLDTHFRGWVLAHEGAHPADYPGQEGRGKFAKRPTVRERVRQKQNADNRNPDALFLLDDGFDN